MMAPFYSNFYCCLFIAGIFFQVSNSADKSEFKCTEDFCLEYLVPPNDCGVSDVFKCNNESIALLLPSVTECSCCDSCVLFKEKGQSCIEGYPGMPMPEIMCGPHLQCVNKICVEMDEGSADPLYDQDNYHCDDQNLCKCWIHENGIESYIFGEFYKDNTTDKLLQCRCAQAANYISQMAVTATPFEDSQASIRCLPNGQFDPLQCIDDACFCVDQNSGQLDDSVPRVPITVLGPGRPICYDAEKFGHTKLYYKPCERAIRNLLDVREFAEADGFVFMFPFIVKCKPDGEYAEELPDEAEMALETLARTIKKGIPINKAMSTVSLTNKMEYFIKTA